MNRARFNIAIAIGTEIDEMRRDSITIPIAISTVPLCIIGNRGIGLKRVDALAAQAAKSYVSVLDGIGKSATAKGEVKTVEAVAKERGAVLAAGKEVDGGGGANGGEAKAAKVPRGKNVLVNGDFEKIDADGKPEGWVSYGCVSVEKEERNTFVRIDVSVVNRDGVATGGCYRQEMNRPNNVKHGAIRAKLRTHGCVGLKRPGANIICKNQEGKPIFWIQAQWDRKDGAWKTIEAEGAVPNAATVLQVELINNGCAGQIDFDDVEVTFK